MHKQLKKFVQSHGILGFILTIQCLLVNLFGSFEFLKQKAIALGRYRLNQQSAIQLLRQFLGQVV